jgi:hypothetical protein
LHFPAAGTPTCLKSRIYNVLKLIGNFKQSKMRCSEMQDFTPLMQSLGKSWANLILGLVVPPDSRLPDLALQTGTPLVLNVRWKPGGGDRS